MKHPDKIRKKETWIIYFSIWGVLSRTFTNHRTAGEGGGHFFNSSVPLPPALRALRHQPSIYWRELTSTHSWQPGSNREPLVSECKSLTTTLRLLGFIKVLILLGLLLRFMWLQTLVTVWHSLLAFLLMCWYKSQSSVFLQDEFQAVLLFW